MRPRLGSSACVLGEKVRFDGGLKQNHFVLQQLHAFVDFTPICPEVAIGMTVPRPKIRLISEQNDIKLVDSKNYDLDYNNPRIGML